MGPAFLGFSLANRTVDEPAEMSCVEFPRWAGIPGLGRTAPNLPAGADLLHNPSFEGLQKENLTLDVHRHLPPTLLEALHCFKRCAQKLRHLFLGFPQLLPHRMKFFMIHRSLSSGGKPFPEKVEKYPLTIYTTTCYLYKGFLKPQESIGCLADPGNVAYSYPGEGPKSRTKNTLKMACMG